MQANMHWSREEKRKRVSLPSSRAKRAEKARARIKDGFLCFATSCRPVPSVTLR